MLERMSSDMSQAKGEAKASAMCSLMRCSKGERGVPCGMDLAKGEAWHGSCTRSVQCAERMF